ncbi:hypothetical protein BKA93DRAFT_835617 [Sparassis latifolia]
MTIDTVMQSAGPNSVSAGSRSGSGSGSGYEYSSGAGYGHGYGPVGGRQQVTSPSMLSDDGAEDGVPYDTLRHKSIRRGILERLKFGTVRRPASQETVSSPTASTVQHRPGHRRADSDFNVDDVQTAVSSASANMYSGTTAASVYSGRYVKRVPHIFPLASFYEVLPDIWLIVRNVVPPEKASLRREKCWDVFVFVAGEMALFA